MIKNFNIKYLPVIFIFFMNFYSAEIKALESLRKNDNLNYVEIKQTELTETAFKKGFIKRVFGKISEKVKKISRTVTRKIKRTFSKRKAKKERMRSGLRKRNKNLFNILVFSGIFILITGLFAFLYFSSVISSTFFLISMLVIGISTIVVALIYLSNRYIVKPHYR